MGNPRSFWLWTVIKGLYAGTLENSRPLPSTENAAAALYHLTSQLREPVICAMLDLSCHLSDDRTLRALRDVIRAFRETGSTLILIDHDDRLPPVIAGEATPLELSLPGVAELEQIIREAVQRTRIGGKVEAKLSRRDLATIVRNLSGLTRRQAEQIIIDTIAEDRNLNGDDVNTILSLKRQRMRLDGVLEYVEAPVDLCEIGGLRALKTWLEQRRDTMSDEARSFGLTSPRGLLLLGVQGAGKSLSAKAVATAWQQPLLRLDPGALYDRFIGESEKRLREALHQAEMMAPIVLWIDEVEKGFASAASRSVDGGLSQRMFGTLLTWMQEHTAPVFLIATANDIDALPPELLRKGRFDEIFFVDLPNAEVRAQIFGIHLSKRKRDPKSFDLKSLATASEGFSGAEIEQAVVSALQEAFAAKSDISTAGITQVLHRSPPLSVTMAEKIETLREWAQGRCVPAD